MAYVLQYPPQCYDFQHLSYAYLYYHKESRINRILHASEFFPWDVDWRAGFRYRGAWMLDRARGISLGYISFLGLERYFSRFPNCRKEKVSK